MQLLEPTPRDLSSRPSQCSNRATLDVFSLMGHSWEFFYPRMFPNVWDT